MYAYASVCVPLINERRAGSAVSVNSTTLTRAADALDCECAAIEDANNAQTANALETITASSVDEVYEQGEGRSLIAVVAMYKLVSVGQRGAEASYQNLSQPI